MRCLVLQMLQKQEPIRRKKMEKIIRVEGKGIVRRKPDLIRLSFHLKAENEKYEKALSMYNEDNRKLLEAVVASGMSREDMKTTNLRIGTRYEQEHDGKFYKNVFKGYEFTSKLFLEMPMDLEKLSDLLSEITERGTTPEFEITFGISDEEAALEEALKEAVLDARKKAKVLSEAMEVSLGHVKVITALQEDSILNPSRVEMPMAMKSMEMDVTPREVEMERRVEVIYEIL